jgi:putative component of membrane protein insertase Oxa1/YidC/SpoIIIJ protein YidD
VPFIYSQTDWERWGKADVSYTIEKAEYTEETKVENPGLAAGALSLVREVYAFFISDHDGDNCPFYPSCSNYYVQAVKEAGIIRGTLMFADRFTRDLNMFKRPNQYPTHISGRFYDPPKNHALTEDKIIFIPSETTVKK